MFKIKMMCHDLVPVADTGAVELVSYVEYVDDEFETVDAAITAMNKCIADELETLNQSTENDFKVTYDSETALAIVQCWDGKESKMSENELRSDRCYCNVTEYDIVWAGDVEDSSLPSEYVN